MVEIWMHLPSRAPAGAALHVEMLGRRALLPLEWTGWRRLVIPVSAMASTSGSYNTANRMRLLASGSFTSNFTINYCGGSVATAITGPGVADEDLLDHLDLSRPGLAAVSAAVQLARTSSGAARTTAINNAKVALATYFRQNFTSRYSMGTGSTSAANTLVAGTFSYVGYTYTFPFIGGVFGEIDWNYNPTLQPGYVGPVNYEWGWSLHRHGHFDTLTRAHNSSSSNAATKASYASFWAGNIRSWVNQEPAPAISDETSLSAWRGLDSGLRLTRQWPASFFVFSQSTAVSNEDIILFLKSVLDHGNFLSGDVYGPGNHFFITMCGLLTQGAVFPEFTDAAFWRERALANLEYSLAENTLPDGAWYELAPSYHDWVVDRLNDAVLTTIRNGFGANVNEALWDKLKTMSEWMVKMGAPDRSVPTVNDSSPQSISTAGFAGWESHFTSPLIEWAELLKTETAGQNTSPDTPIRSVSLPDSGYTVLRSGWGKTDHYTLFDVGPLGGWHGHQDALNLVTFFYGRPFLFDNGGYTYDTSAFRDYGTATASHNTVMVDNLNQARIYNTSSDPIGVNPADTPPARFGTSEALDYASGWYVGGYGSSTNRIATHRRELAFLKTASGGGPLLLVVDTLSSTSSSPRAYDLRWHLKSTSWQSQTGAQQAGAQVWTTDRDTVAYPLIANQPNLAVISVSGPSEYYADSAVNAAQGNDLLGWFYPSQTAAPTPALALRHKVAPSAGKVRLVTLLVPFTGTPQNPVTSVVPTPGVANSWTVSFLDNRTPITISIDPAAGDIEPSLALSSLALPTLEPLPVVETLFSYTNSSSNSAPGTAWSSGGQWSAVPVGSASTSLLFGTGVALAAGQTIFANNDIAGDFLLNRLNVSYSGPASGTAPTLTLAGNPLQFVNNGALPPSLVFQTSGVVKPSVTLNQNLVFTHNATFTTATDALLGGVLSGAGGFTKDGGGILRYQGNSPAYSGNITVEGGNLQIGNNGGAGNLGTGTITLAGGNFVVRRNGGTLALNNTITGTGSATFQTNANFVVTLNKANTYAGATTLSPTAANTVGTLQLGINNGLPPASILTITNSGTSVQTFGLNNFNQTLGGLVTAAGGNATNSKVTLGNGTLTIQDSGDRVFAGEISGTGNVAKQGVATWTLSGPNTYSGTTSVTGGTLLVNSSLASSATSVASTAALGGSGSLAGTLALSGTLAPGNNSVGTLTTGALTLAPGAALEWQIDNWTGAAGTGYDRVVATSLALTATAVSPVTVRLVGPSPINFSEASTSFTLVQTAGAISGFSANRFVIDASGLTVAQGTWAVGTLGNNLVINYTRLNQAPTFPTATVNLSATEGVAFSAQLVASDADVGDTLTYSIVSGPSWLTVSPSGALGGTPTIADVGTNNITVRVTDSLGATAEATVVVTVARANAAPTFPTDPINLSGTVGLAFSSQLVASDTDVGETLTYSKISGPTWLTVSPSGALGGTPTNADLGTNNFTVRVTDSLGATADATVVVTVTNITVFNYNGTTNRATPGLGWSTDPDWSAVPVSGIDTTLTFGNASALASGQTISTSNDLGIFSVNQLNISYAGPASGTQPIVTLSTGAIHFVGNGVLNPTLNLNATGGANNKPHLVFAGAVHFAANTTISGASDVRFGGTISQAIGAILTKTGPGVVRVDSDNPAYTGQVIVEGGALQIGNNGSGGSLGNATVTLADSGNFTVRKSGNLTMNNLLTGTTTGAVNFQLRNGAVVTLNRASTYTAGTSLSPTTSGVTGKLQLGIANGLPASTPFTINNSGASVQTFELNGFAQTLASLSTGAGGNSTNSLVTNSGTSAALTLSGASTTTYAGTLSGAIDLYKSGSGTQSLTGNLTYSGDTTVTEGILALQTVNPNNEASCIAIASSLATLQLNFTGTDTVDMLFIGGEQQAAGVYKAPGNPAAGVEIPQLAGPGTLTVTSSPPVVPYQAWATGQGLTAANSAPGLDPDGDGHVNLIEFALNGHPLNGSGPVLRLNLEDTDSNGLAELTLTLAVRNGSGSPVFSTASTPTASVDGITYAIEGSLDLVFPGSPVSETARPSGQPSLPEGWEYRRFRLDAFTGSTPRGFLRVKVTTP
jgi:autotransporter-associated beta strand protein